MATVTNPTRWDVYVHELRTTLQPGEIVEVEDEIAKTMNGIILTVELDAKQAARAVKDEVEKVVLDRKAKAQTGTSRPGAETR